ncbi:MAG: hypothetical protein U9N30_09715 [Campylobacterota bacterium]|nr:hypothetical protein [Campylobacterota bacterium]
MKIEFRKVSPSLKEFKLKQVSVNFEGSFCKISSKLVEIDAKLSGATEVPCCKCGETFTTQLNEDFEFIISDGIYDGDDETKSIVEIEDGFINFDEIVKSEIESIRSDYHTCEKCFDKDDFQEIEL